MNNKYKILFVEDDANISGFVTALLEANGYSVISAVSYSMAKTLYYSHVPDLVILDLGLPDEDGGRLLADIRKSDPTPVIVLSARGEEGEKVRLLDMGANDYVTKPFGSEELLAPQTPVCRVQGLRLMIWSSTTMQGRFFSRIEK